MFSPFNFWFISDLTPFLARDDLTTKASFVTVRRLVYILEYRQSTKKFSSLEK